ncbi:MAG: N-acetyl-alpha-D-glucosaminyl L-malate synthase BshA [Flavobacteriales bacterium]
MKIGIVCYPTFGGSGVIATELGKALAKKGHQIHFITYKEPVRLSGFTKNIFYHEVNVSDYPLFEYTPYELVLTSKLVDVAQNEGLDLFHVHYAIPHASAAYMAQKILSFKGKSIPVITTLHGTDITLVGRDSSFEPVISFAIQKSDIVTTVSESLKYDTFKHFDINREIEVVNNFIDPENYITSHRNNLRENYAPNGEKILTHISNFRRVKRVEDIVHIFRKVTDDLPAKLLLIGDGEERHNIERLCRELGTCDDIIFLGKLREIEPILAASDLFILTSEHESFGLAALEAMATGVPVISTNTGGLPEVNKHGITGYLSDVGDVENMGKNAINILQNEERLKKFKKNSIEHSKNFHIDKILPQYEKLYEKALSLKSVDVGAG